MSLHLSNLNRNPKPHHHLQTSNQKIKVNANATTPTVLVNANPSHTPPIRNIPTLLCHFATKTVPAKRSKRYRPHQNAHFVPAKSFYQYEIANSRHPTTLPQKYKRQCYPPQVTQSHNTKSLIHHPPKKRSRQGSAYPNIKHYRTMASLMHSTIYLTSSSVT